MANPQRENGHIDIANEIAEFLARYRLSGQEYQVLWVIWRKTWGWHKKKDAISLSQIAKMTGMKRPAVVRALNKLLQKGVIKKDNSYVRTYRFNKDYETWKSSIKKDTCYQKRYWGGIKKDNKTVIKKDTYKRKLKETITKENIHPTSKKAGGVSLENLEMQVMASPYFTDEDNFFFSERKIQYFMDMLNRLGKKKANSFTPTQIIVEFYKQLKRFVDDYGVNEKAWDRINFKRFSKSASQMFSIGNEDIVFTLSLLYRTAARLQTKNLSWTLETCVKNAPELLVEFRREDE